MLVTWLELGSLILGLTAWILPLICLLRRDQAGNGNWTAFSLASIGCCGVSLCLQIFYFDHLVKIEDWSALLDTSHAVVLASSVLIIITVVLYSAAAVVSRNKK